MCNFLSFCNFCKKNYEFYYSLWIDSNLKCQTTFQTFFQHFSNFFKLFINFFLSFYYLKCINVQSISLNHILKIFLPLLVFGGLSLEWHNHYNMSSSHFFISLLKYNCNLRDWTKNNFHCILFYNHKNKNRGLKTSSKSKLETGLKLVLFGLKGQEKISIDKTI